MSNDASGKEKALLVPLECKAGNLADPKDVAREPLPPHKVLKIFSINIIAQGLPFCRRRVSIITVRPVTVVLVEPQKLKMLRVVLCLTAGLEQCKI